mmetsp:Transcript_4836/g.30753  ORF Transcript_4836/g.30753 Transcript_4836/m.30753 type:complete len:146 (+) Transcript_4836:3743-4180(+)
MQVHICQSTDPWRRNVNATGAKRAFQYEQSRRGSAPRQCRKKRWLQMCRQGPHHGQLKYPYNSRLERHNSSARDSKLEGPVSTRRKEEQEIVEMGWQMGQLAYCPDFFSVRSSTCLDSSSHTSPSSEPSNTQFLGKLHELSLRNE